MKKTKKLGEAQSIASVAVVERDDELQQPQTSPIPSSRGNVKISWDEASFYGWSGDPEDFPGDEYRAKWYKINSTTIRMRHGHYEWGAFFIELDGKKDEITRAMKCWMDVFDLPLGKNRKYEDMARLLQRGEFERIAVLAERYRKRHPS